MAQAKSVATLPDGSAILSVTLKRCGLSATILSFGAILQTLKLHDRPVVLGFDDPKDYVNDVDYIGATIGRFANRISNAEFIVEQKKYQTDRNFLNKHTLHGGRAAISSKNWTITDFSSHFARFETIDRQDDNGFPGDCRISCTYHLRRNNCLDIELEAVCTKSTPCSITHHSYFNLDETQTIVDHKLLIAADNYLPVDGEMIPNGSIASVEGTNLDFRKGKLIGDGLHFDHNFCLADGRRKLNSAAKLSSEKSGIALYLLTTQPGLQFYAGGGLGARPDSKPGFAPNAGLCLEPQAWPNAPNQPGFPTSILKAGETYRHLNRYQFTQQQ